MQLFEETIVINPNRVDRLASTLRQQASSIGEILRDIEQDSQSAETLKPRILKVEESLKQLRKQIQ